MSVHPERRTAITRAARTAVVACIGFYLGRFWLDDVQVAVFATFTPIALMRLYDYQGTRRQRIVAHLVTLGAALVVILLGTAVSGRSNGMTIVATISTFVVVVAITLAGVGGGYLTVAGATLVMLWVVASCIPAPIDALPSRLAGALLGGLLALLATELVLPERTAGRDRTAAAAALHSLARLAELVDHSGSASAAELEHRRETARDAVLRVQPYLESSVRRPIAPTAVERARFFLFSGLARLYETLDRRLQFDDARLLEDVPRPDAAIQAEAELYRAAVDALDASGQLVTGQGGGPDIAGLADAALRHRRILTQFLENAAPAHAARTAVANGEGAGAASSRVLVLTDRYFVDREVAWLVSSAAVETLVALGVRDAQPAVQFAPGSLGQIAQLNEGRWATWLRRVRANLSFRSVIMRNALRLALGLAVARAVIGFLDLPNGYWVALAVVVMLRSSIVETGATAAKAVLGTALGFLVAVALVVFVRPDTEIFAVALPAVVFLAFFVPTLSFVAGQACFTLLIVVLFNLIAPANWRLGLVRLEDVLIGTLIGAAVALAAWPRGATGQLKSALGGVIDAGAAYVDAVAHALLHRIGPVASDADVIRTRKVTLSSLILTRDVFAEHLHERAARSLPTAAWTRVLNSGYRLWHGGELVATHVPSVADEEYSAGLIATLDEGFRRVRLGYEDAARCLHHSLRAMAIRGHPALNAADEGLLVPALAELVDAGSRACARTMLAAPGTAAAGDALRLLVIRAWLLSLGDDLTRLRGALAAVDPAAANNHAARVPPEVGARG